MTDQEVVELAARPGGVSMFEMLEGVDASSLMDRVIACTETLRRLLGARLVETIYHVHGHGEGRPSVLEVRYLADVPMTMLDWSQRPWRCVAVGLSDIEVRFYTASVVPIA